MIKILFNVFKRDQESIKSIKRSKTKRLLINIIACAVIVGVFFSVLSPLLFHANEIKDQLPFNLGNIAIMVGFTLSFIIALISSFGFLFSGGYLDKNLNSYITLPIKKRDFVIAKLMILYYSVIQIVALVMLPCIIIYFMYTVTISFNAIVIIIFYTLTMPIITIYAAAVILGTALFFINKLKNKALAKNLLFSTFFVVAFSAYMFFVLKMSSTGEDYVATINMIMDLSDKISLLFFYPNWATAVLNNAQYLKLAYMVGALVVGFICILYFEKVYFKGSVGFNETSAKSKAKLMKNAAVPRYPMMMWFFIKEAKEIIKTGTYFFNTIFGNILIVVIYLGMMGYAYFFQNSLSDNQMIFDLIDEHISYEYVILLTLAIGTFFTIFNNGGSTVFSREAKSLNFINTLPLNQSRAFFGKVLFHALCEFLTLFIFMLVPMLVLGIGINYILTAIVVMMLIVLATNLIPVCVDLNFPTLDWESETQVVKRSRAVVISMIIHFLMSIVIIGGSVLLYLNFDIDYKILTYLLLAFYVIMFIVLVIVYRKSVTRAFRKVKN